MLRNLGTMTGLLAGLLLAGCTFVVQPPTPVALNPEADVQPMAIQLPDGSLCQYAGTGATLAFDGERLNYTCGSPEVGLLGDPVVLGGTEWQVEKVTLGRTGDAFTVTASEIVPFTAWRVTLADGTTCLHAGFGATLAFDEKRLNYTCAQSVAQGSGADEVGLLGELSPAGDGIWRAEAALIAHSQDGFALQAVAQVPVAQISGVERSPEPMIIPTPAPEAEAGLLDVTWAWQQTTYADGTTVAPEDPSDYLMTLHADGTASFQLDCNRGAGGYTLEGTSLTLGVIASTMMACLPESQADVFAKGLAGVQGYALADDTLTLESENGTMTFMRTAAPEGMAAPTPVEEVPMDNPLVDTTWQWQETLYGDDTRVTAEDPARYTITFLPDGQLSAQVDCNRGMGSYTLDGSALTLGPIATTRMACPPDSQDSVFLKDLAAVNGYVLEGDVLTLVLQLDTGTMTFSRAE